MINKIKEFRRRRLGDKFTKNISTLTNDEIIVVISYMFFVLEERGIDVEELIKKANLCVEEFTWGDINKSK